MSWQSYTNTAYSYIISIPSDWSVDDSDESWVFFDSPDNFAGVIVDAYSFQADLSSWVDQTLEYAEADSVRFELFSQRVDENTYGTGVAFIIYLAQIASWSCLEHVKVLFVVTSSKSYSITSSMCHHAVDEYTEIERAILFDNFDYW